MTVYLSDYLHLSCGNDTTPALSEALLCCKKKPDSVLIIDKGIYHFYPDRAFTKEYYMSNNDGGRKPIACPVVGFNGLTIDGNGSEFIFHGKVSPFVIDASENVTIRNLSIDYVRPFYSQGRILASENGYTDICFDKDYPFRVENGKLVFFDPETGTIVSDGENYLVTEFDEKRLIPDRLLYLAYFEHPERAGFLGSLVRSVRAEQLNITTVRLYGIDTHKVGAYWVATHSKREHPGFFIQDSKNVTLEDITIYHSASMGIIGQMSEDITLRRIRTERRNGRLLTVNADATHFVHCSGTVLLEDCVFTHMLDDGGNFHGNYTVIEQVIDAHTFIVRLMHNQQQGVNIYRSGESISLVERASLKRIAGMTVRAAFMISEKYIRVETEDELPEIIKEGMAVENHSRMPQVIIRNCEVGWNRPRGFLISTCKKALIDGCTFSNMNQAIHLSGDANSWFESGSVQDLTIRNCIFRDSAYTAGFAIVADPVIEKKHGNYYHGKMVIEDCIFESDTPRILDCRNIDTIVMRRNRFVKIKSVNRHPDAENNGFRISECRDPDIGPLTIL